MRLVGAIKASHCPQDTDGHSPPRCLSCLLGEGGPGAGRVVWFAGAEREQSRCDMSTHELGIASPAEAQGRAGPHVLGRFPARAQGSAHVRWKQQMDSLAT